ncbi:alpha-ketoacid dehydrogenase subunit beta [Actinomadura sp. B10D3]|uniref:alpha-ketoacid dehydrogenase subunit beta n=1 Tax=Actinomadura sp. B10D3 TaxID=3153557 RepID=UPI00325D7A73
MHDVSMVEAIRAALGDELERDERTMILGQDVGLSGGVFRATDGLQARFGAHRVVDTPLAEGVIVGSAVGLAVAGRIPIVEIQFLGFTHQAFHQISDQVARMRWRSRGRYGVPLVIRAPFGGGVRTPEMHADALEAKFVQCPGLKVVAPATVEDAYGLLVSAIRDPDPVLFLEPLRGYRLVKGDLPAQGHVTGFGKARVARRGEHVTVLAWSAAVQVAERAAETVAREGISCTVLDLRTLVPLDEDTIHEHVARTGRAVVVHEAPLTGGFGAEVAATVSSGAFYNLEAPVERVTGFDAPYPVGPLEEDHLPNERRVADAIRKAATTP